MSTGTTEFGGTPQAMITTGDVPKIAHIDVDDVTDFVDTDAFQDPPTPRSPESDAPAPLAAPVRAYALASCDGVSWDGDFGTLSAGGTDDGMIMLKVDRGDVTAGQQRYFAVAFHRLELGVVIDAIRLVTQMSFETFDDVPGPEVRRDHGAGPHPRPAA